MHEGKRHDPISSRRGSSRMHSAVHSVCTSTPRAASSRRMHETCRSGGHAVQHAAVRLLVCCQRLSLAAWTCRLLALQGVHEVCGLRPEEGNGRKEERRGIPAGDGDVGLSLLACLQHGAVCPLLLRCTFHEATQWAVRALHGTAWVCT